MNDECICDPVCVLDKGFVRLVDYMGSDDAVVQAARVSYQVGTAVHSTNDGLIDFLMRHKHTGPFEQVVFKFHMKLPIFVARQIIRHRTASVNELSGRYSIIPNDCYLPELEHLCEQDTVNKQGRSQDVVSDGSVIRQSMEKEQDVSGKIYKRYLQSGLCRELARINLPLSTYTEWYWTMDLHNLLHFLELRMDRHAQYEVRLYANAIAEIIAPIVPATWAAFKKHVLEAVTITREDMRTIIRLLSDKPYQSEMTTSVAGEFNDKLRTLGYEQLIK